MTTFRCDIVSAENEIFQGEATLLVATGEVGELGIAARHAPLITRLKPGKVVVTLPQGEQLDFAISGGILEVQPDVVTVLADTAIRADEIDEAAVRKAKEEAERCMSASRRSPSSCRHWSACARTSSTDYADHHLLIQNAGPEPAFCFSVFSPAAAGRPSSAGGSASAALR